VDNNQDNYLEGGDWISRSAVEIAVILRKRATSVKSEMG